MLLRDLALLGLDSKEAAWSEELGEKAQLAEKVQELLMEKADMLRQYFSIYIDKNGYLKSLPYLLGKIKVFFLLVRKKKKNNK